MIPNMVPLSRKTFGQDLTPIGEIDIIQYQLKNPKWSTDQDTDDFGTVNNRLAKELEIYERLFGPLSTAQNLPGKGKAKGAGKEVARTATPVDLMNALYSNLESGSVGRILDSSESAESLAEELGITSEAEFNKFKADLETMRADNPILGDNGKAGKSVDFLLASCHPDNTM